MKSNEATHNRPDGNRILDDVYVAADLNKYIGSLKNEEAWLKSDRNAITLFKTGVLTVVLVCLHKDATIIDNTVNGVRMLQVIEGAMNVNVNGETVTIAANQFIALHPDVAHHITATEDTVLLISNHKF